MPYKSISDLPDSVRDNVPKHAQEIYKEAFNSAWDEYADKDDRRGDASREETAQYLTHRLRRAGTELPLFEPAAVESIFQASGGLPRRVNGLAHHTLLAAAGAKAKVATADHVQAAIAEVA